MPFLSWLHLLEWSTNKWNHSNAYRPPYLVGLLSVESWPVVGATFGNIQGYGFVIFVSDIRCVHVCAHGCNVPLLAVTSLSHVFYSILNQLTCCFFFSISLWVIGAGTNLRIHTESWCFQMVTNAGMGLIEV